MPHSANALLIASSFTTTTTIVLGLFAALGLGGVITTLYSGEQTRIAGMRDRMISAADEFVTDLSRGASLVGRGLEEVTQPPDRWNDNTLKSIHSSLVEAREACERHIPRLTILYPVTTAPTSIDPAGPAFEAIQPLAMAELLIEDAREARKRVTDEQAGELLGQAWHAHGAFAAYAHEMIWRRRPDRPPSWLYRRRKRKIAEVRASRTRYR